MVFVAVMKWEACNFIEKETSTRVFSCKYYEFLKNNFFTEHLRTIASVNTLLILTAPTR